MMSKKISNNAARQLIESELGIKYQYPKLYTPDKIMDGVRETTLSIITIEAPERISYGIWGILPYTYADEWEDFQSAINTLTVPMQHILKGTIFRTQYGEKRCLIIVTGFFIYHFSKGVLYPYYVYATSKKPFCVAGVYTTLKDGFITCAILTQKATKAIAEIQNLEETMPIVVPKDLHKAWLNPEKDLSTLQSELKSHSGISLQSHAIAKEFFKNQIIYDTILDPVYYDDIPDM